MKAIIQEVLFKKEIDSKFGKLYSFNVKYDDKMAIYRSKSKDQKKRRLTLISRAIFKNILSLNL